MRRNILFNNKAYEVAFITLTRKEVPYYIRKKLEEGKESYIQKKRNGRCVCYVFEDGGFYYHDIEDLDDEITGYGLAEKKKVSPYIRRKLKQNGSYIRRNDGVLFRYKYVNEEIYIAEVEVESSQNEEIYKLMNSKDIRSRISEKEVMFVKCLVDEHYLIKDGVFCDGVNLIDNVEDVEDDISQMYCNFKDGGGCNMEDFYSMYGAYERGSAFIDNIKNLIRDRDVA